MLATKEGDTQLNTGSALWTRQKKDITDEQYKEFYHHVAHSFDEPWLTMHNKAEGRLEYTNLNRLNLASSIYNIIMNVKKYFKTKH